MPNNNNEKELIEYRVTKLEEAVTQLVNSLNVLKDIVVKWDSRVGSADWIGKSMLTDEKLININNEIVEIKEQHKVMKDELDGMKKVMWKASGALVILSFVAQLLGPIVVNKVFGSTSEPKIEIVGK